MALALALPVLLTGCAAYVGDAGPGYPGYYDGYNAPGYYDGGPTYVGIYGYNRGYYHHDYRHEDSSFRGGAAFASRSSVHAGGTHFASVSHSVGHSGGGESHSASASMGGGGHSGGGHR